MSKRDSPFGEIEVKQVARRNHGIHWRWALSSDEGMAWVFDRLDDTFVYGRVTVLRGEFLQASQFSGDIGRLVIANRHRSFISAYPILRSRTVVSFFSRRIDVWTPLEGIEADISGIALDGLEVSFFAVDYLENASRYQNGERLMVQLVGFAKSVYDWETAGAEGDQAGVGLSASGAYDEPTIYNFVGEMVSWRECSNEMTIGTVMSIRMNAPKGGQPPFLLDVFVHRDHCTLGDFSVGMMVAGTVWLQGRVVV